MSRADQRISANQFTVPSPFHRASSFLSTTFFTIPGSLFERRRLFLLTCYRKEAISFLTVANSAFAHQLAPHLSISDCTVHFSFLPTVNTYYAGHCATVFHQPLLSGTGTVCFMIDMLSIGSSRNRDGCLPVAFRLLQRR